MDIDMEALVDLKLTVPPYQEVKAYLDERAHETMRELREICNKLLSFEGEREDFQKTQINT